MHLVIFVVRKSWHAVEGGDTAGGLNKGMCFKVREHVRCARGGERKVLRRLAAEDSEKYPTCSLKSHLKKSLTWRDQTRVVSASDEKKEKMEIKIGRLDAFNELRNARSLLWIKYFVRYL